MALLHYLSNRSVKRQHAANLSAAHYCISCYVRISLTNHRHWQRELSKLSEIEESEQLEQLEWQQRRQDLTMTRHPLTLCVDMILQ